MKIFFSAYYCILTACVSLYAIVPMSHYKPLEIEPLLFLIVSPLAAFFAQSFLPRVRIKFSLSPHNVRLAVLFLYLFWFLIALSELFTQGTAPIFSLGSNSYAEWGSQGLGGLMNAIALVVLPYFAFYDRLSLRLRFFSVFSIFVYQLITIRRGHFIFFACYLLMTHLFLTRPRISPSVVFRALFIFSALVISFGIIGDFRGEHSNPFLRLFDQEHQNFLRYLPTGFVWALTYFTSPLSNLNSAWLDNCSDEFSPIFSLLPNPLKSSVVEQLSTLKCENFLDNSALNVSTGFLTFKHAGLYAPFYLILVVYAMASASHLYRNSSKCGLFSASLMSLCFLVILATFFSNFFFLPTYALAFCLLFLMASLADFSPYHNYPITR
ncbi:MAG: hypothetical protein ACON4T_03415 [Synechococcus sp.]